MVRLIEYAPAQRAVRALRGIFFENHQAPRLSLVAK